MSLEKRIKSLVAVRNILNQFLNKENTSTPTYSEFENIIQNAEIRNPWFTRKNILKTLTYWNQQLTYENLTHWLSEYKFNENSRSVGLILAGNIPMVGFHDCLCVLLTGYHAKIKLSSKDTVLIPFFLNLWKEFCEEINFEFIEKLENYDAVIITGSNNTAKHFEYYFRNVPHIIRKNRTSVGILSGKETEEELLALSEDIFTYFGLGCRNVTQIFIPKNYDLDKLFHSFLSFKDIINHNKYINNYDYNKAIYLMNNDKFWDNNFVLLKESEELYSPIAVLYFKNYNTNSYIEHFIAQHPDEIQCIVSNKRDIPNINTISLGEAQNPKLYEYADGIDTMKFLLSIS